MANIRCLLGAGSSTLMLGIGLIFMGTFYQGLVHGFSDFDILSSIWLGGGSVFIITGGILMCCYLEHKRKQGCHGDRVHVTRNQSREPVVVTADAQPISNAPATVVGHDPPQLQYLPPYSACQPRASPVQAFISDHEETTFPDRIYEDDVAPPSYDSVMKNS